MRGAAQNEGYTGRSTSAKGSIDLVQSAHHNIRCETHVFEFRARAVAPAHAITERLGPGGIPGVRRYEKNLGGGQVEGLGAKSVDPRGRFVGLDSVCRNEFAEVRLQAIMADR